MADGVSNMAAPEQAQAGSAPAPAQAPNTQTNMAAPGQAQVDPAPALAAHLRPPNAPAPPADGGFRDNKGKLKKYDGPLGNSFKVNIDGETKTFESRPVIAELRAMDALVEPACDYHMYLQAAMEHVEVIALKRKKPECKEECLEAFRALEYLFNRLQLVAVRGIPGGDKHCVRSIVADIRGRNFEIENLRELLHPGQAVRSSPTASTLVANIDTHEHDGDDKVMLIVRMMLAIAERLASAVGVGVPDRDDGGMAKLLAHVENLIVLVKEANTTAVEQTDKIHVEFTQSVLRKITAALEAVKKGREDFKERVYMSGEQNSKAIDQFASTIATAIDGFTQAVNDQTAVMKAQNDILADKAAVMREQTGVMQQQKTLMEEQNTAILGVKDIVRKISKAMAKETSREDKRDEDDRRSPSGEDKRDGRKRGRNRKDSANRGNKKTKKIN